MRFSLFLAFSIDFLGPTAGRDQDWRHDQFQDMDRPRVSRAGLGRTWAELCLELLQAEKKGEHWEHAQSFWVLESIELTVLTRTIEIHWKNDIFQPSL